MSKLRKLYSLFSSYLNCFASSRVVYLGTMLSISFRVLEVTVEMFRLKGLGHAILGNFSTDRMVIELTKISK